MANLHNEFILLAEDSRVGVLLELVKTCRYDQQLLFLDLLQEHLHRDFIGLLPEHLVRKVLCYLSVTEAINCASVSKRWSTAIGACSSFWSERAQELGLSANYIEEQLKKSHFMIKSVKDLCALAVRHQSRIRSLSLHTMLIARSLTSSASVSYRYAGNGIALGYREQNGHAQVMVERIVSTHSLVEIAAFSVESFSGRIKWVSSSGSYVLWKQVDGQWCGCDTTNLEAELEQWVDEPVSQGFHSISFCHCCHLIAILSEAEDDVEVWDLQVVKLERGKSTVRKMVYPLPLERVQRSWEKKRHFLGGDVMLLSETEETDESGFCQSHQVLLQVDSKLVVHSLKAVPVSERLPVIHHLLPDAKLSKPLHVFSPHTSQEPLDVMDFQVSKGRPVFCFSREYSRVALLHESYLYVWLLGNCEEESCTDLLHSDLPTDCKCVAVGSMYAVLASDSHGSCYVVVMATGEVLIQGSSSPSFNPETQRSTRFSFFAPVDQDWLSNFQYSDICPVAILFDYFNSAENSSVAKELKVLVGMGDHALKGRLPFK